jgi:bifunctional UDP-N-acetylglucosamine pyrophosphorylase / glucosamine-1-phosphate N-acetyltransferase
MSKNLVSIILAAGQGKRMQSPLPKVLHPILKRPMVEYVLEVAEDAGIKNHYIVVGYKREQVEAVLRGAGRHFAIQEKPLGTGHAVQAALAKIGDHRGLEDALILCGDTPCLQSKTIQKFIELYEAPHPEFPGPKILLLSCCFQDPTGYGRILRNSEGGFLGVREDRDCSRAELGIQEINTGIYLGSLGVFTELLKDIGNDNDQGEYYLTDICKLALARGYHVDALSLGHEAEFLGVNSVSQLQQAEKLLSLTSSSLTKYSNYE